MDGATESAPVGLRVSAGDALFAVVVAVASAGLFLLAVRAFAPQIPVSDAESRVVLAVLVVQALVLVVRRQWPVACLVLVVAGQVALTVVLPPDATVRLAAPLIAAYTVGALLPRDRVVGWLGVAVAMEVAGFALLQPLIGPAVRAWLFGESVGSGPALGVLGALLSLIAVVLTYGAAGLAGLLVAALRDNRRLLEARTAAVVAEQQARTALAVEAERVRMARELHDIAAHHLTGLVVQAAAAEQLLDRDPEGAREAVRSVRGQGKEALASLRSMVHMLRERGPAVATRWSTAAIGGAEEPAPGLDVADRLVASARDLGDQITFDVRGAAYPVPAAVDITAFRVLQEALTNARQHAPGSPVDVMIDYGTDQLQVGVVNAVSDVMAADDRRGYGLVGMHERAQLVGAELEAGMTPDGRWRVLLRVPRNTGLRGDGS